MIYIVEDDASIRELEQYALQTNQYTVRGFEDGASFWAAVRETVPDLVILDVMLPDEDGYQILGRLRETAATRTVPVIMVTAKTSEIDVVKGLDHGADDYLCKPFGIMEFISRVKAVLRRASTAPASTTTLRFGDITLDDVARTVTVDGEPVELIVFAAASMTETMNQLKEMYEQNNPNVTVTYNFDSSGKLLTQIKEGADCDLFISAAPTQMNAMDGSLIGDTEKNPDGLDLIVTDSRVNLLENKVTLAVPEGNPKGIESFDQLAELLKGGDVMLAIGNSDVPVGQYTLKIFNYYGIDETAVADKLTYGNNVKEVTSQVSEAAADCGIIYATDAYSAGLTVADSATAAMSGPGPGKSTTP